jgi:hypothetical protein
MADVEELSPLEVIGRDVISHVRDL